jgi:hypothetical protein
VSFPAYRLPGGWVLFDDEIVVYEGARRVVLDCYMRQEGNALLLKYVERAPAQISQHYRRSHATHQRRCRRPA